MLHRDIAYRRLANQLITQSTFEQPADIVAWQGAVQAQDFAAAKWAIGLRMLHAKDDAIEEAFASGAILRTHILRPTWHFVSPASIRWMLALTAPHVRAASAYQYRRLELDDAACMHTNAVLEKALQGSKQLTRQEILLALQLAGVVTEGEQRLTYILMRAELDGVICSGARQGKQFTYALLDERVPKGESLDRNEALAALAVRYFASHGPATVQDFVWWSGLSMADARAGLAMVSAQLLHEVIGDQTYWFSASAPPVKDLSRTVYFLPNYDEYIVGYKDRSAIFDVSHTNMLDARGNILFNHVIVLDGRVVGTWKRTVKKDVVIIAPRLFIELNEAQMHAITVAASRYAEFLNGSACITFSNG